MPNPIVAPKANRIDESAVATSAPRITGVQCRYLGETPMGVAGSSGFTMSAQPEERQYGQDDDNQSHQIDQTVHFSLLALLLTETSVHLTLSDTLFPAASTTRRRPEGRRALGWKCQASRDQHSSPTDARANPARSAPR